MKKYVIAILILILAVPCFAQDAVKPAVTNNFVPIQQVKGIAKYTRITSSLVNLKPNKTVANDFLTAHERYTQSNVSAAYNEYEKLIEKTNNDFLRIMLAYELSEKGYFTLAQINFSHIKDKSIFGETIKFIQNTYFPNVILPKDDELKLANYYTDIYYNNLPFETAKTLGKDTEMLKKSDYAYYILAQAYLESKMPSKALNSINKAISLNKNNLNYQKYKAQILTEERKFDEALDIINNIILQSKSSSIALEQSKILKNYILAQAKSDKDQSNYYLAKYLYEINDVPRAIREANASTYSGKQNINVYNLLGEIYLSENNLFKSAENYQKAKNIKKKNPQTIIGLANIEFQWDDYDTAIELYTHALKKEKNNEEAMLNLAICYTIKNDLVSAKSWLTKLLTYNPYNYKAYYLLSFIDNSQAEDNLKKAIAINPMYLDAWGTLAKYQLEKGQKIDGVNSIFPLEYLAHKNFMYYYCIGLIHKIDGKYLDAQKDFEQAINLYSEYTPAKNEYKNIDKLLMKIEEKNTKEKNL